MTWTLRKKILIGYGVALGLVVLIVAWALGNLLKLGRASDAILRENYRSIQAAGEMADALQRQDSALLLLALGYTEEGAVQYRENESQFLQWLGRAKDNITIAGEADIVAEIEAGYAAYRACFASLSALAGGETGRAVAWYREKALRPFQAVRQACDRLREINQKTMFSASEQAHEIARRASWSGAGIGTAAVGLGLGFSLLLSNLLVRPLRRMVDATQQIAQGRYDVQVQTLSSDELGLLAREFNTMVRRLQAYHNLNIEQIIAEKRKGEAILQNIDDGIVVVDADLRVTDLNPTAAGALGVDPDRARGRHFLEVVRSDKLFTYVKTSAESCAPPAIAEGGDILSAERDGIVRHYQFSVTPVLGDGGVLLGVVLLLRDVTKLKELDRLKSEFVMTASHELKTPLTSIGMGIALLLEGAVDKLDQKEQQLLRAAHEDVQRLKALISNLLDLSRIEAGKMEMEFDRVPVRMLFEKAVAVLKGILLAARSSARRNDGLREDVLATFPEAMP